MMIAIVMGVVVLGASTSLAIGAMRSLAGTELRDGIDRQARFIGIGLQRDVQQTGIEIDAQPTFGTIGAFADTLVMLRVPFFGAPEMPAEGYARDSIPGGSGVGNCGALCVEVRRPVGEPFQINAGELAYLELNASVRRLLRVTAVSLPTATVARVTFANTTRILGHPAGIAGLNLSSSFKVRTIRATAFYRDAANQLIRADSVTTAGAAVPQVVATGIQTWDASLVFVNGVEAAMADADTDADPDNDYDDIARVHLRATIQADRADSRVNNGVILSRVYDWWLAPRNLIYERNRI
ncbi:MAG: hypothetical protein ABI766_08065 [Gemmatimonadales bacterium]